MKPDDDPGLSTGVAPLVGPVPAAGVSPPDPAHANALAVAQRRFDRERAARKAAEALLTDKSRELWDTLQAAQTTERRLQAALLANGEGIWDWQVPTDRLQISGLMLAGQAMPVDATTLAVMITRLHAPDRAAVAAALHQHDRGQSAHIEVDFRLRFKGELRWLRIRGRALGRGEDGHALQVTGTIRDVSDQHEAEHLRQLMAHAFASTMDALVVVGADWTIVQANSALVSLLGLTEQGAEGRSLRDLVRFEAAPAQPAAWRGEARPHDDQGERPFEVSITRVEARADEPEQHLVALRDISERRRAEQALERLALSDTLTGLANRAAINRHLAERVARPEVQRFALMFVDLDGFKAVNDSFGHRAGDALLCEAGVRLRATLPNAFIGRWGGDEFVLMLADGADDYQLRESAQLVIATLSQPFMHEGHRLSVTPSIGAVHHPEDGRDAALLLRHADAAMYEAKAQGRNCLVIYQPSQDEGVQRRSRLQSMVRRDADRNAFHFVVQPKVNVAGRMTGAELLMRWNTEEFGVVSPVEFIPIAEQIGAIPLMGRHALHAAAKVAHEARAQGSDVTVAVNLSPRQLLRPDLERTVLHACQHNGVEPSQIELELTESALVADIGYVEKLLHRLRRHGFKLALDDFGTGYSSLSHLLNLPFHKVKIDRSFVMNLATSAKSRLMLEGVVRLCNSLGLVTVAEGVETAAQFELLRAMGIPEFQGYYFARPQPQQQWLDGLRRELAAG